MIKKYLLMTVFVITLLLPGAKAAAFSGTVNLSCAKTTINPGETTTCSLNGSSTDGVMGGFSGSFGVTGSSASIDDESFKKGKEWSDVIDKKNLMLINAAGASGNFTMVTFSVIAGTSIGDSTVLFSNTSVTGGDSGTMSINVNPVKISVVEPATAQTPAKKATPPTAPTSNDTSKSGNTYLSSISLSDSSIDFYKDTTEYSFTVPYSVTNIEVMTVLEDEKSSVTVEGNTDLAVGENTITILVTAENGATRTYTLIATRENDNKLAKTMKEEPKSNPAALFAVIALPLVGLIAIIIAVIMIIKRKKNKLIIPDSNPVPGQPESFGSGGLTEPAETYSDSTTNSIPPSIDEYTPYEQPTIDQPMEATPTEYTVPAEATPTTTPPIDAQPVDEVMPQNNYFK